MTTPEQDAIVQLGRAHDDLDARMTAFVDSLRSGAKNPWLDQRTREILLTAVDAADAAVTETPADPTLVEVRAPRWHKGEDAPDWLVPGATVRVVQCGIGTPERLGEATFVGFDYDRDAETSLCNVPYILELVAPAPEPAVDWEARAKAAEIEARKADADRDDFAAREQRAMLELTAAKTRIDKALAHYYDMADEHDQMQTPGGFLARRMARALRGES